MRKFLIALILVAFMPVHAFAQSQPALQMAAKPDAAGGFDAVRTVIVTAGVVGGVIVADLLTGGSLTASLFGSAAAAAPVAATALPPAVMEARAAGAVLGEMITPATAMRDVAARADLARTAVLGAGAVVGGMLLSWIAAR
ncbi:MFS transporter [Azospirillaceae bacterium]